MSAAVVTPIYGGRIVRRARLAEIEAVCAMAKAVPNAAHWSHVDYLAYCTAAKPEDTQAKALFVAYIPAQTADAVQNIEFGDEKIVGFAAFSAIPQAGGGVCELENMAVAEPWRRQGIALRLLASGLLWCRAWCPAASPDAIPEAGLGLEVRASNHSAIAFYEHAGFAVVGRRPAYYTQPEEEAILMSKPLNSALPTC